MSRNPDLKAINCVSCGAGLDVLGGGRVVEHICPYCGTALDATDGYKALRQYKDLIRPASPFGLGMQGTVLGVEWTIIGTVGMTEKWGGRVWTWVEHQVFSPTHGYAYLTVDKGHTTFTRRERTLPSPKWISARQVERSDSRPSGHFKGERFVYYETSTAEISFLEGEFNWSPKIGDRSTTVSMLSKTYMLDYAASEQEELIYLSQYLDPVQTCQAFGVPPNALKPIRQSPLEPFVEHAEVGFLRMACLGFTVVTALFASIVGLTNSYVVVPNSRINLSELPQSVEFEIEQVNKMARITLAANGRNSWSYVEFDVEDPSGETIFETGRSMEQYNGVENGEGWTEGSNRTYVTFVPETAGPYRLTLYEYENELWNRGRSPAAATTVSVAVTEGRLSPWYLIALTAVFAVLAGVPWLRYYMHNKAKWAGSDWVDEDDD
jgi:hypothetical protein